MAKFQWLRKFDRQPSYVTINYNGRKIHQSRTGGCISIIFLISTFFILFFKLFMMFQQNNVIFQIRIGKDDFGQIQFYDAGIRVQINDKYKIPIPCNKLSSYNLQVILQIDKQRKTFSPINNESYKMSPCNPQQENQTQFCVNNTSSLSVKGRRDVINTVNLQINQQNEDIIYQQISIKIRAIQSQKHNNNDFINNPVYPVLRFTNNVINQQIKNISQAVHQKQQRIFQTAQPLITSTVQYTFQIKKVVMLTDYTIIPTFIKQNIPIFTKDGYEMSWFYGEQFTTQTYDRFNQNNSVLFVACFKRSMYTHTYIRHFTKLDTVLAESFGLIGFFSFFLFFFYKGYNQWILEKQNIGQQQKSLNVFHYYKYRLVSCCRFISFDIKKCLTKYKCYNCLKFVRNKLCSCLYKSQLIQQQSNQFLSKKRLEDQLDIYKTRRQVNYLKKKVQVLQTALDVIAAKVPEIKIILDQNIKLSQQYQLTDSLITSMRQQKIQQNILMQSFLLQ